MADDTESYFVSLAVQRGLATREAAQECLELARTPRAAGRSVLHLLVERARIPPETARGLHQEAVAMAAQARARGSDLQRWVSGSTSSSGIAPPMVASTGARFGPTGTVAAPGAPPAHGTWPTYGTSPGTLGSAASVRARTFNPGETFGDRYRLEAELGRGGMGVVWRARQLDLDRPVALKMLVTGTSADDRRRKRFLTEARAVARVVHPNIVAIHDVGEIEGVMYFTMDLVEGPSLADAIKARPFEVRRALEVARGIADGLACAHAHKIVHRDLKPANILLDARGTPRITDFGIAKDLDAVEGQTITGEVLGTPAYMPPEQAAGHHHLVDGRADVYALGAIIYRMVAGRPPFEGATPYDVITKVIGTPHVPLRKLDPDVPEVVDAIVSRCLAKNRDDRYPTAEALLEEISKALEQLAPARPGATASRPRRRGSNAPLVAGAVVVALLGVAVGVAGWWRARQEAAELARQREAEERARREAEEEERRAEAARKREEAVARAREALERRAERPQEALAMAREAAGLAPDVAEVQAALGQLLLEVANDPRAACAALDRALELDPDHLAARASRARCFLRLDRPVHDIEAEAARLDRLGIGGRAAAAELRAEVALIRGELPVALVHLDEAVQLDAKNPALRLRLTELLLRARRFSAAEEEATSTLRLARTAAGLVLRATARKELGRAADALADARAALDLEPGNADARALVKALQARPTPVESEHGTHESVHMALEALKQAIARRDSNETARQLRLAMELPDVPCAAALVERASLLMELRQYPLAAADMERLQALQGESARLYVMRATAMHRMKRLDEAERFLTRALELEPQHLRALEMRAQVLEERGDLERAEADWSELISRAPEKERAWLVHERAHHYHRRKQYDLALADMNAALEQDKSKGHLWMVRGEIHADMGHPEEAIADLQEALRVGGLSQSEEARARQRLAELSR